MSLLASLGCVPVACGGTALIDPGSGGATAQGGSPGYAGGPDVGGATARAGATSYAGFSAQGGSTPTLECRSPTVDATTQLVTCASGTVHRPRAVTCAVITTDGQGAAGDSASADAGAGTIGSACQSDADCRNIRLGYCSQGGFVQPTCAAGCVQDHDCGASALCLCDGVTPGRCVSASCHADADCGSDSFCSPSSQICGGESFNCLNSNDECRLDSDCGGYGTCSFEDGHRTCERVACGRPFLVDDRARVAAAARRADWLDGSLLAELGGLSGLQRAQLAAHWSRLGQLEHASIAAFARFSMQLLSLGAPAELLEACNAALVDETAHARTCFALASQYGGEPVGPARLDIQHCLEDNSLAAIMKLVLREGCVGETVASLEAAQAAVLAQDPALRAALVRIARDERSHAKLAFDFMSWALGECGQDVRAEIAREAEQRLAQFEREAQLRALDGDGSLSAHGVLGAAALRRVHLTAAREVVRPLLAALFSHSASASGAAPSRAKLSVGGREA